MDSPDIPDPNQAAVAGAQADVANFPMRYMVEALAKMGGKATIGGKTYDFSGLGDADNAAVMSDQMAQTLLDIQKQYGGEYVKQRLANLKQSDPAGYAARQQLFDKIMADAEANPDRPLATDLQGLIADELGKGAQLDAKSLEQVQEGVRGKQVANGIMLGNAPASEEAGAVVKAGENLRTQRQQQSNQFLQSGVSPEDVEYRRVQQALSNLGNFVNGANPVAQFSSVSGAQNGAAPFTTTGNNNVATNPNAAAQGQQNALNIYSGQVNWANSQTNPYLAGLSVAAGAANTAAGLGWNPTSSGSIPSSWVKLGNTSPNWNPG